MELVDVPDSKSGEAHTSCRFDPDHRQIFKRPYKVFFYFINIVWLSSRFGVCIINFDKQSYCMKKLLLIIWFIMLFVGYLDLVDCIHKIDMSVEKFVKFNDIRK